MAIKYPPDRPLRPVRLLVNGYSPVYTPSLKVTIDPLGRLGHIGVQKDQDPSDLAQSNALMAVEVEKVSGSTSEDDGSGVEDGLARCVRKQAAGELQEYEDENQPLPSEGSTIDGEDEEGLSDEEIDIISQATKLAMERDEAPEDVDNSPEEYSDSEDDGDDVDDGYVPNAKQGKRITGSAGKTTPLTSKAKPTEGQRKRPPKNTMRYEFCPLPHRLSILRLLAKHFCQHPMLPERHGQSRTSQQIHRDAVYEAYLHCRNNKLREVWAYLWTNWYAPDKWKLWARSAHPISIPRKRTTMLVEAMWRNYKRMVLYMYNRPRVDFATYALVTQALQLYRVKFKAFMDDPRRGRAAALTGEQAPIKKAWLRLRDRDIKGAYNTNVYKWTCSCGAQKYHSYLLCKHLVQKLPRPGPDWWTSVVRYTTPPFYDIRSLLPPEEQARAQAPEDLRNYAWLDRTQPASEVPDLSSSNPVSYSYIVQPDSLTLGPTRLFPHPPEPQTPARIGCYAKAIRMVSLMCVDCFLCHGELNVLINPQVLSRRERVTTLADSLEQALRIIRSQTDQGSLRWIENAERQFSPGIRWVNDHTRHENRRTCPKTNEKDGKSQPLSRNVTGYASIGQEG